MKLRSDASRLFLVLPVGSEGYEEPHHPHHSQKPGLEDQPIRWICHIKYPLSAGGESNPPPAGWESCSPHF
jgi:hypothetical protein